MLAPLPAKADVCGMMRRLCNLFPMLWCCWPLLHCAGPEPVAKTDLSAPPSTVAIDTTGANKALLQRWGLQQLQLQLKPSGHYGFHPNLAFLLPFQGQWQRLGGQLFLYPSAGQPASAQPAVWVLLPAGDSLLLRFRSQ